LEAYARLSGMPSAPFQLSEVEPPEEKTSDVMI
jgi:hypothetical protein